jgi:hypothetical protein
MYDNEISEEELNAPPADPFAIEACLLPSGGKVYFRSLATVTGEDLRWIRSVDDKGGNLALYGEMMGRAMIKLVDSWDLTTPSGRPVPLPREKNSPYDRLISAFDLAALERHLRKPLDLLLNDADADSEGE